ncbi:hypothetical protein CTEN210_06737 [Chaetoceros tenuissimus]|uniref:EF-hand domain-containing protein n=1 Tax=Chaetoceros tenuissimus TaxID=426638 RepID=A0AAD3CQE7_9STRA|nr:hypothetical protein CTEN210_06737 [Chaetoceros tenuissimus]
MHACLTKTNTMSTRAVEAIALNPQNDHGAWYFQSLSTGRKIRSHIYKPLPISDRIINRVTELGTQDNMPEIQDDRMIFEWTPGNPIDDDDLEVLQMNVNAQNEGQGANNNVLLQNNQFAMLTDDDDYDSDEDSDFEDDMSNNGNNLNVEEEDVSVHDNSVNENNEPDEEEDFDNIIEEYTSADEAADDQDEHEEVIVEDVDEDSKDEDDDPNVEEATGRGHRNRKPNSKYYNDSYTFLQTPFEELEVDDRKEFFKHATDTYMAEGDTRLLQRFITGFVFTQMQTTEQMSAKKGIEMFGEEAVEALFKELAQLVDMTTFKPRKAEDLTRAQKRAALRAINLIKRKRCGKLKGRTVANGKQQRGRYDKSKTASPTATLEAILMTCMIDAMEGRHVAVADVVGAYLKARMEDFVLMKFTGETVDILCNIDPSYKDYVTYENGEKVLYVELLKALYGCVQSALLWYELFSGTLVDMGFKLNPFDMCIANANINGSQCTVCIYVDDNKISHKELAVVKDIISKLESKFGKMEVTHGDEHTFLGMKIKYNRKRGTVTINMKEYVLEAIEESGMDITRNANTPAKPNLYIIDENSELLNEDKKERFHSVVAKLCYIAERSRLDIKPAMSFLRTRVQKPTVEDWGKLKRVLCYLRGTIDLHLTLGADTLTKLQTWVDASYAIHNDRKSHTGGAMSFGRGVICSKSNKQKLNRKSSTEAEVVGASDYLPNTIWLRMFLEAQGYIIEENLYYQDNESAMKIELNGWRSTGSKSKHVDIRFYFIADRVKSEKIEVHHCKTEHMVADFFTKPLQGALFRRLRDIVMGVVPVDTVFDYTKQERVVKNDKPGLYPSKGDSQESINALDEPPLDQTFPISIQEMTCFKDRSFQRYKLERYFDLLDFDNNQRVNTKDLVLWGERAAANYEEAGIHVPEEKLKDMRKKMGRVFNCMTIFSWAGKNKKRFVNYGVTTSKLPFFKTIFRVLLLPAWHALDFKGNGELSLQDFYFVIVKPIGLTEEDAKIAFQVMDEDKNGMLSVEEFTQGVIDYFSDTEVTKHAFAYGGIKVDDVPEKYKECLQKSIEESWNDDEGEC